MKTFLGDYKTLEETLHYVKVYFKDLVKVDEKQQSGFVVIACEQSDFDNISLLVNEKNELYIVRNALTDDDDGIHEGFELTQSTEFDTKTMNRFFYQKDTMTVREFWDGYKLEHSFIENALLLNY